MLDAGSESIASLSVSDPLLNLLLLNSSLAPFTHSFSQSLNQQTWVEHLNMQGLWNIERKKTMLLRELEI